MWKCIRKYTGGLTIDDLPSKMPDIRALREKARILIIDDNPLTYEKGLRAAGFQITVHEQWTDLKDVEPYQIIISDNNGVANSLGGDCNGISMVRQATKVYPEKRYAVYSGDLIDSRGNTLDNVPILTKGDSFEDWVQMLDDAILNSYNPKQAWKLIAHMLECADVTEKEKREIQHTYVRSLLEGSPRRVETATWSLDKETLSLIVRIVSLGISTMRLNMML